MAFTLLLLLATQFLPASPAAHDLKLSVCEMVYQPGNEVFECTFYLFEDDLKHALYGDPFAPQLEQSDAAAYVAERFAWQVNKKTQPMQFHSLRRKNDQVAVQFTSSKIPLNQVSEIHVKNTLLIEKFPAQVNMVYAVLPQQGKKVQMLTAKKTGGHFVF